MRWQRGERSRNLEDRRAESGRRSPFPFPFGRGGAAGGAPRSRIPGAGAPKLSLSTLLILLAVAWFFGGDLLSVLGGGLQTSTSPGSFPGSPADTSGRSGRLPPVTTGAPGATPAEEELVDFVSFVLDDLQSMWGQQLNGYQDAKLVLFRDSIRSGCGHAAAQMGPFYCPADQKVYVDLSFYEELRRRFGAPGDFAQAYVLAHEIGHHIQKLSGIEAQVRQAQRANPRQQNELSVRMELQADCLSGIWARSTAQRNILEPGDIEEGLAAAAAIGDDRIQKMSTGRVHPESFTHGSSKQRVEWFRRGLEGGTTDACDTFASR